jgi:hypothetical protein
MQSDVPGLQHVKHMHFVPENNVGGSHYVVLTVSGMWSSHDLREWMQMINVDCTSYTSRFQEQAMTLDDLEEKDRCRLQQYEWMFVSPLSWEMWHKEFKLHKFIMPEAKQLEPCSS